MRGRRFIRSGTDGGNVGDSGPCCDCRWRWNSALVGVYDEDEGDEEDKMVILEVGGGDVGSVMVKVERKGGVAEGVRRAGVLC